MWDRGTAHRSVSHKVRKGYKNW